jgi:hypothetical protein
MWVRQSGGTRSRWPVAVSSLFERARLYAQAQPPYPFGLNTPILLTICSYHVPVHLCYTCTHPVYGFSNDGIHWNNKKDIITDRKYMMTATKHVSNPNQSIYTVV